MQTTNKDTDSIINILENKNNADFISKVIVGDKGLKKDRRFLIYNSIICIVIFSAVASYLFIGGYYKKKEKTEQIVAAPITAKSLETKPAETKSDAPLQVTVINDSPVDTANSQSLPVEKVVGEEKYLETISELNNQKSLLAKELINMKKEVYLLSNIKNDLKAREEERDLLNKRIEKLNNVISLMKGSEGKEVIKLSEEESVKKLQEEKDFLETKIAEMKGMILAMEERENRRPELNKQLEELKGKNIFFEDENKKIKESLTEMSGAIEELKSENENNANLKEEILKSEAERRILRSRADNEKMTYHYNLGVLYSKNTMYENAEEEYKKALQIKDNEPDLHYNLAVLYDDHLFNHKKAAEHYKRYIELVPEARDIDTVKEWLSEAEKYVK